LQHTDALSTNYAAQFVKDSFQELTTETWRGEVGMTHQLRDWLTTTVQVYGLQQQADKNADVFEWGGLLSTAFAHDNPLGRFSANLSYNHTQSEARNGARRGIVIGESATLRDPLPTYLAQSDVDLLSLVVTDAERKRTYLPVRDYVAMKVGRYAAIIRVPTGEIADRETVLVSYTYQVADDYRIRRDRLDVRLQQDFKFGLSPYYAGSFQDEDHDRSDFLAFRERDVVRHRLGATYRRRLWSVGAEYEYNDDGIDPYQALHANGDAVLWQKATNQLDAKSTLSHFRFWGAYDLPEHQTTLLDVGGSYRYLVARDLEASATALYRYEDDSLNGLTHGADLSAAVDWRIGYFTLRFEAEYDLLQLPGSADNSASFWIKLRRDIPVITKETR
jgi:hypothetical protein